LLLLLLLLLFLLLLLSRLFAMKLGETTLRLGWAIAGCGLSQLVTSTRGAELLHSSALLEADDECLAGVPEACALNAVQLRGQKAGISVSSAAKTECAAAWGQCGGAGWAGSICCEDTYVCNAVDPYFSQCGKPIDPLATTTATTTTTTLISPDGCSVAAYKQCAGFSGGAPYAGPSCCVPGYACTSVDQYYSQCQPVDKDTPVQIYSPAAILTKPSDAPTFTFYMYRVQSAGSVYPLQNVNAGTLPGILWYLHNEVVWQTPRKFDISEIQRVKLTMKATQPLLNAGMHFGARYAFDAGQCTGPFNCDKQFEKYGYFVGCNNLGSFPFPEYTVYYPNAIWYSLPGPCPSKKYMDENATCRSQQPGGRCSGPPTGTGDCTYSYELAGKISVDELEGIKDYDEFVSLGYQEYHKTTDKGHGLSFWDGINDLAKNQERVEAAGQLFKKYFPDQPLDKDMPAPTCDFEYTKFFGVPPVR